MTCQDELHKIHKDLCRRSTVKWDSTLRTKLLVTLFDVANSALINLWLTSEQALSRADKDATARVSNKILVCALLADKINDDLYLPKMPNIVLNYEGGYGSLLDTDFTITGKYWVTGPEVKDQLQKMRGYWGEAERK